MHVTQYEMSHIYAHCASITAQLPDTPVKVEINDSPQV